MRLRSQILLLLIFFGLVPLIVALGVNVPLVFDRLELFYQKAYLQNLRADFRDLDEHMASRQEMVRLLAKTPEPGLLSGLFAEDSKVDLQSARVGYAEWVNRVLQEQLDIVQVFFLDEKGQTQFWLERDAETFRLGAGEKLQDAPDPRLFRSASRIGPGGFLTSPIRINPGALASDPRRFMMLHLISPIFGSPPSTSPQRERPPVLGAVVISLDIGGLARAYPNAHWVLNDGRYLEQERGGASSNAAFADFPGLDQLFAKRELGLWKGPNERKVIWVPLLMTEASGPLWVGRRVDPSPIANFRQQLVIRVALILVALVFAILFLALLFALRAERFGHELTKDVSSVLNSEAPVQFSFKGPRELQALGENLTRLAHTHAENSKALRRHALELEESNRYKSQFLANVSHELRTPLNSILLLSKMLAENSDGNLKLDQVKQAEIINNAGNDLSTLIDNILDLSRIEARKVSFNLGEVDLPLLLDSIVDLVRPQAEEKGLSLELQIDADAPRTLFSDSDKIGQIVRNFLSNALKFTPSGGIRVALSCVGSEEALQRPVRISVSDTGVGIPPEQQPTVFEAFQQADGTTSRRYGGTGLGLAISRELAGLLGGRIELDSQEGEGSTFSLLLPVEFDTSRVPTDQQAGDQQASVSADSSNGSSGPEPTAEFRDKRMLVVEDNVRDLLALAPVLEGWGIEVTAAGHGNEALDTLRDHQQFDLALVAITLPDLAGLETIAGIRAQAAHRDLPIIALISEGGTLGRDDFRERGADEVLTKPIDPEILKEILTGYLDVQGPSRSLEAVQ